MLNSDTLKCTYTNEQTLIILLTRLYFGTYKVEDIRDFLDKEAIDWNIFYRLISVNDIRGFIYGIITESQITIDRQIHDTLKKDAMAITLIGSYQTDLLNNLKKEFEKLGIVAIPYKGNTLAARYYKSPLLRESLDIDFLISKEDLPQLRKCLYENGYESRYNISEHQMGFVLRFHRDISFISLKNRMGITCSVELQWKLLENYFGRFYQHDFFVQHLQSYTATDCTQHIGLAPTYDFLCVASHHLIKDPLLKFKYLIDLACMVQISSDKLDWEEINAHFKLYKFHPFLTSGMNALEEIIGLKLPIQSTSAPYHLFTATENRTGRELFFERIKFVNLKLSFLKRIKHGMKVRLHLLVPNFNDLSMTDGPAWSIPLIVPGKFLRYLYLYITKRR